MAIGVVEGFDAGKRIDHLDQIIVVGLNGSPHRSQHRDDIAGYQTG